MLKRLALYLVLPQNSVDLKRARRSPALVVGMVLLGWSAGALFSGSTWYLHGQAPPHVASQANKPAPTASPIPEQPREPVRQPPPGQSHGDGWIMAAEVGVAIGTLLLFAATAILAKITNTHVQHFKRLVDRIDKIYELQASARVAVSLVDDETRHPWISVQNICQVPLILSKLSFQLSVSGSEGKTADLPEVGATWLLPGEARAVKSQVLGDLWKDQSAESVTVDCFYLDVYPTGAGGPCAKTLRTVWRLDYTKKSIALESAET